MLRILTNVRKGEKTDGWGCDEMDRIKVLGKMYFNFHIKSRLIDKLRQGVKIFSDSRDHNTVYTNVLEIPIDKVAMKDENTLLIPPLELHLKVKLTLIRDKRSRTTKK